MLFITDPEKRKAWVSMLDKCGCETVATDNVKQGIESALAFSPQLVITEVSLANQFKIIEQLRVNLGLNKVLFTLLDDTKSI